MAVDWSKLPTELLGLIALRLISVVEIQRFRSICPSWRSSVSFADINNPLLHIHPNPLSVILRTKDNELIGLHGGASLSGASFSRVTLSSSSSSSSSTKSWLIKYDSYAELNPGTLRLLNPLSRLRFHRRFKFVDLMKFTVSEIQPSYTIHSHCSKKADLGFKRVVVAREHLVDGVNHQVLGVCTDGRIRYWNGVTWTRVKDQVAHFHDIIIHQGLPYALDSRGILWWISSRRGIFRFGPQLDDDVAESCSWRRLRSLVGGSCGKFYIVDRIVENNERRSKGNTVDPRYIEMLHDDVGNTRGEAFRGHFYYTTVGFKVYTVDDDLWRWVVVKNLGDNAFVIGDEACLAVKADEFYGCLPGSIYFCDEGECEIKVFKLDDGSIETMSGGSQSCFQMFVPSFD
ncbi:unnamed protein product [Microthlaspi erraticum]|uniref:KIB1-4 beta-propeller domain-containing protein n=1 Tax=Microthlaspi erraticum TaxID=1685480 RepID=A0A6D2IR14_9BRAS|nr:unnamed protein product [Microthlaspi erraticum]